MTTKTRSAYHSTAVRPLRRLVALVLLLCVGAASVEVLFGNEPGTAVATVASSTPDAPQAPLPTDGHDDEGCPCLCACGCAGAVLTVAPLPWTLVASTTVQRVVEVRTMLRPAHRTTPPRARPPLA